MVATLALFVGLSGGVYAAAKISGSKIKKESIAGKKLKDDGVTGAQIDESSLGRVPSAQKAEDAQRATTAQSAVTATSAQTAATATNAQTAQTAETLGGTAPGGFVSSSNVKMMRFDVTIPEGQGVQGDPALLELGPLKLAASCSRPLGLFIVSASTSAQSAGIDAGYVDNSTAATMGSGLGPTPVSIVTVSGTSTHRTVGTIVYNDPQTVISIPFALFYTYTGGANGASRCFFTGSATLTRR